MGEVPEILVERKYLKQLKQHACTIERLFGVHLLLSDHDDRYDDDADDDDDDDNDDELNNKFVLDATKENNAITKLGDVCSSRQQQDEEQVFVRVEVFTNTLSGNSVSKNVLGIMSGDEKHHNDHSTLSLPAVEKQHSRFLSDQIVAKVQRYVDCTVLECGDGNNTSAEAEDSSYDSDFETEEQPVNQTQPSSTIHSGVSRTTSDTLAAEFAEYVTVEKVPGTHSPGYTARVEFALKLGYTEKLVQAALHKLGPDPEQNELLAELIRLGASSTKLSDSPDETNITQDHENASDDVRRASAINSAGLRPVVIDGSNVAMSHGNKEVFSCRGIKICVDWFRSRGHKEITVFVPKWRKEASRPDNPIADQEILGELERDRLLVFTPSRLIGGKRMVCYDDRYILRLAAELDGIVVSNDNYRDLAQESPEFRKVVGERILMYSFVNDRFMPPDDPLGRSGPTLENFLKIGSTKRTDPAPPCPYAKKCTYGNKCKFRHPERGPHPQKSVTERLVEHAQRHLQARVQSLSLPLSLSNPNVGNTMKNNNATAIASATSASTHQPLCKAWSAHHTSVGKTMSSPVSKSKSVENIPDCSMKKLNYGQQLSPGQVSQALPSCAAWPAPHVNNNVDQPDQPVNMHKKLQRQLTLNPTCDPRLYQLMKYRQPQPPLSVPGNRPNVHHRFLEKRTSADSRSASINWNPSDHHHQHLTRISSAPDSSQGWQSRGTLIAGHATRNHRLGTSEPQLNSPSPSPMGISQASSWAQDARRHLHYHLANIFPQEQVQTALAMYPHETDPQKICATILAMFPKS